MQVKTITATLLAILLNGMSVAQQVGEWQAYVSHADVQFVTQDSEGRIWSSTSGGMVVVDNSSIAAEFTLGSGLYRVDATATAYDAHNNYIWRGYNDATVERINAESGAIVDYGDIRRSEPGRINAMHVDGQRLYVAMSVGIVVFDTESGIVRNSYLNLGEIERGSPVTDLVIEGNTIFATTDEGVAAGNLDDDLADPQNWQVYNEENGLPDEAVELLSVWNNEVLAFTEEGTYRLDINTESWQQTGFFGDEHVTYVHVNDDGNVISAITMDENLYRKDLSEEIVWEYEGAFGLNAVLHHDERGTIYAASAERGVLELDIEQEAIINEIRTDGPFSNVFTELKTDGSALIAGSSQASGGFLDTGFYILSEGEWRNYNRQNSGFLRNASFRNVFRTGISDSSYYFGSYGRGFIQYDKNSEEMTHYDTQNSPLRAFEQGSSWVIVSGVDTDHNEDIWLTTWTDFDDAIYRYDETEREFEVFNKPQGLLANAHLWNLMLDSNDHLWATVTDGSFTGRGLAVMRQTDNGLEGVQLTEDTDSGNLRSETVNVITEDRRGEIWIGTNRGVAQFSFPDRIIDGGTQERQASLLLNADTSATSSFLLHDVHVNAIEVNAANEKWIGTEDAGLWLISPVGGRYEVVEHFTRDNSQLISDRVTSLALDDDTGVLYIATDIGLTSYTGTTKSGVAEMDELYIYPNPYNYRKESSNIKIEGLSNATKLNVLTSDGRVVNRIETRGGRIEWDGRDFQGNRVASGVYVLVAVDEDNGERGTGKVVIIR